MNNNTQLTPAVREASPFTERRTTQWTGNRLAGINPAKLNAQERKCLIQLARRLAEIEFKQRRLELTSPKEVREYLDASLLFLEHEVFVVVFLDNRHRLIATEEMFRGTIDGTSVPPREVVKRALQLNAAAVIFAHNHPSGTSQPSESDKRLTTRLRDALALVEIRALDHIVVGADGGTSFAEHGLM
ncbi:MAG: DNA repair protein RadC [Chromatiales bacterium]|nr:DNA repair protein RadC [Chromatiales bacterium]